MAVSPPRKEMDVSIPREMMAVSTPRGETAVSTPREETAVSTPRKSDNKAVSRPSMLNADQPGFVAEFYGNSRLHHLSTWRTQLKDLVRLREFTVTSKVMV